MSVVIRAVQAEDIAAILAIYRCGIDRKATFETEVPTPAAWDRKYLKAPRLAAVVGEEVVGYAVLAPTSDRHVYRGVAEVSCYLAPRYTGQGIGTLLMQELIAQAGAAGIWTIEARIIEDNTASLRLCEKCGFRRVGVREKPGYDRDGIWKDIILLEKRLKV